MTEEEYLKLFQDMNNTQQPVENLNETKKQEFENLNKPRQQNQWENLNETPNMEQYNINENLNGGWGTESFQTETRINGQIQQNNHQQYQQPRRRRNQPDPNGLNQFCDDENLNEVVQQPRQVNHPEPTPIRENINDMDVVSVELFNQINENAMLHLAGRSRQIVQKVDVNRISNNYDTKVTFLKS